MGNIPASLKSRDELLQNTTSADLPSRVFDRVPLVVLSDYPPSEICEPLFRMGEWLRLISHEGYWVKVYSVQKKKENYIPSSHVAKVYHEWLFEGVARHKAEELLQLPGNRVGSFMVRESTKGVYALSVRHTSIKHYRIYRLPNNWYFISPRLTFQCLEDLVNHYSDIADGLCCILTGPCLAAPEQFQFSQSSNLRPYSLNWNVNRSELVQQNGSSVFANQDTCISLGLQNSVASYLSLAGVQEKKKTGWRRHKWRSVYLPSYQQMDLSVTEDDSYEDTVY